MQFLTLIHIDPGLLAEVPEAEYDRLMRGCFEKADALQQDGCLQGSQQLENPDTAKTLRVRNGISRVTDGPFAETREFLAGFNLIEADSMDRAMEIARQFPWARFGSIEVRPVRDIQTVREHVGAKRPPNGE
ncbi:MAG TPA: YciI family protein [Dokdonella sp.]|uniref:YciI family protein n=1 Tax=Dokdonella sp. TaxID=2291710 RepID=UPI002D7E6263|nr:YciI family protein [Dokdonella sp.]HET9034062.1 YciI family protein [Dokdonella sp.]